MVKSIALECSQDQYKQQKIHLTLRKKVSKLPALLSNLPLEHSLKACLRSRLPFPWETSNPEEPPSTFMIGLIAKKIGMSRAFLPTGEAVAVTYLEIAPNTIVRTKTKEKDGYDAVVLGIGAKLWKTRKGAEHTRYKLEKEFMVESLDGMEPGKTLTADVMPTDSMVTICGTSKGRGFAGVVKRHGFHGGPKSHGSHFKREPGSIGMRADPGRIFRGHRMAGHMGTDTLTLKHRSVIVNDTAKNLIAVKGPVPGPNGAHVFVTLES